MCYISVNVNISHNNAPTRKYHFIVKGKTHVPYVITGIPSHTVNCEAGLDHPDQVRKRDYTYNNIESARGSLHNSSGCL